MPHLLRQHCLVWLVLLSAFYVPIHAQTLSVDNTFITKVDVFFNKYVNSNGLVNYSKLNANPIELVDILMTVDNADLKKLDSVSLKAFYINAYNLIVIKAILNQYPLASPVEVPGFFDGKKHKVGGKNMTLNQLEDKLRHVFEDPRIHFALACGGKGCPPLANFAYTAVNLATQLDAQTRKALNNDAFIKLDTKENTVYLSQIFQWYQQDFAPSKSEVINYINTFRQIPIPSTYAIKYYTYDWSLNSQKRPISASNNSISRYFPSTLLAKQHLEVKIFNNLYTQKSNGTRSSFFTTFTQLWYGISDKINLGIDIKLRSVHNSNPPTSPFAVLKFEQSPQARWGITAIGPKIKIAPFKRYKNISLLSTLLIPIGKNLGGVPEQLPYIDNTGLSWWNQLYYDIPIRPQWSLFAETSLFVDSFTDSAINAYFPLKAILNYYPTQQITLYVLGEYTPYVAFNEFVYYVQAGGGLKYQIVQGLELEFLYTAFSNNYLQQANGTAATYNIGLRFTR